MAPIQTASYFGSREDLGFGFEECNLHSGHQHSWVWNLTLISSPADARGRRMKKLAAGNAMCHRGNKAVCGTSSGVSSDRTAAYGEFQTKHE